MDRKTLIFTINRLYDVLDINERGQAFEYLEKSADDSKLYDLYTFLQKFIKKA